MVARWVAMGWGMPAGAGSGRGAGRRWSGKTVVPHCRNPRPEATEKAGRDGDFRAGADSAHCCIGRGAGEGTKKSAAGLNSGARESGRMTDANQPNRPVM